MGILRKAWASQKKLLCLRAVKFSGLSMPKVQPKLLLASSSSYRAALLRQLFIEFDSYSPNIDESPLPHEPPSATAKRLSYSKAKAAQAKFPEHIIIASDQVACMDGSINAIGKPYTPANAIAQLSSYSAKTYHFYTGLSVLVPLAHARIKQVLAEQSMVETFSVTFRELSERQIRRYVEIENPIDCAGSFKAEGLGISLFSKFEGRDYTALIGLPLMALVDALYNIDIDVLTLSTQNPNHSQ